MNRDIRKKQKVQSTAAKKKAPIYITNPQRIKLTLREQRLKCNQLQEEIYVMKNEINKNNYSIDNGLTQDFIRIISNSKYKMTPFMELFWQQQKNLLDVSSTGARFHPMIIRFYLSLALKSSPTYEELRNSNILRLPSMRTLRDYRNFIKTKVGFQEEILKDLIKTTRDYLGSQHFVVLLLDEMKIREKLVFDKHAGSLTEFIDLCDPEINFLSIEKNANSLATHDLVFMLRGITTELKYIFDYFATNNVTTGQLLFWDAVGLLELRCNLWVIAATSDGASSNRRLYRIHSELHDNLILGSICHKTVNLFADDRYIYFLSDAPHLLKTARNCLYNSGYGKNSRYMWNAEKFLIWHHIIQVYQQDQEYPIKLAPKISD